MFNPIAFSVVSLNSISSITIVGIKMCTKNSEIKAVRLPTLKKLYDHQNGLVTERSFFTF